ncbi:MAG: hypothetical protein IPH36_22465 [Saprospiraceae bacterium]|nr:hypothetical protein [Saprospiraceae bacterium]
MKILILVLVLLGNIYHCSGQDDIRHIVDSLDRQVRLSFDKRDSIDLNKIEKIVRVRDSAEKEIIRLLDSFITNEANYCTVIELVDVVIKQNYLKDPYAFFLDRAYIGKAYGFCELSTEHIWIQGFPIFYYLAGKFPTETVDYLSNSGYLDTPRDERILKCISYFYENCLKGERGMPTSTKCECDKLMKKKMAAEIVKYIRK